MKHNAYQDLDRHRKVLEPIATTPGEGSIIVILVDEYNHDVQNEYCNMIALWMIRESQPVGGEIKNFLYKDNPFMGSRFFIEFSYWQARMVEVYFLTQPDYNRADINSQDIVLIIDWQDTTDTDVGDMRGVS